MLKELVSSIILGLSLAAPVGPVSIEMIRRSMYIHFWAGLFVGIGAMTADLCFMLLIYIGLSSFLTFEIIQFILYTIGSFVFFFLALSSIKTKAPLVFSHRPERSISFVQIIRSFNVGFWIALLNPINIVFWFAIYGSILSEYMHSAQSILLFKSLFIFLGIFLWNLNIAFLAHYSTFIMNQTFFKVFHYIATIFLFYFSFHFLIQALKLLPLIT